MTKDRRRNMAASVRQRLMNQAREQKEDFGLVLTRYGLERLLYRLSQSSYREQFVLKGAMLFQLWSGQPHRPTRDLDLLGHGDPDPDRIQELLRDICRQKVELAQPDRDLAWDTSQEADAIRLLRLGRRLGLPYPLLHRILPSNDGSPLPLDLHW